MILGAILGIVVTRSANRIMRKLAGQYVPPVPDPTVGKPSGDVIDVDFEESVPR